RCSCWRSTCVEATQRARANQSAERIHHGRAIPCHQDVHDYLNDEGTEVNFVHVYADAASMEVHETVVHEDTSKLSKEFLEMTTSLQIYGKPSDMILKKTRELAEKGIPLNINPEHVGGFTRLAIAAH